MSKQILQLVLFFGLYFTTNLNATHHDPKHFSDLMNLLHNISQSSTGYTNGLTSVSWPTGSSSAACYTDSSGLATALFQYSYGYTPADYQHWFGKTTPQAVDYYNAIAKGNQFQQLTNITKLTPGDLIVIRYPQGVEGVGDQTGYVGVVYKHASFMDQASPFIKGAQQWTLHVIDSVAKPHDVNDSRNLGKGQSYSGLGYGTFRIYIDAKGNLVGYTWGPNDKTFYSSEDYPIVVGRLQN